MFQQLALTNEMHKLAKFAQRLTKNTHDSEDLLQRTVLRALEKKEHFQPETNLFSWASKIMFNLFVSDYRQSKKFETQYDPSYYIDRTSVQPMQEIYVDLITVGKAMERLSTEHREILIAINIKGFSYEEAAEVLKIKSGTVRSRVSRARNQLQFMLCDVTCRRDDQYGF